ncbi:MAG: hypothetical protein JNL82_33950 [Myxococcales bacterium]|nr:hypothetical protein [Myxococcales bacterium]
MVFATVCACGDSGGRDETSQDDSASAPSTTPPTTTTGSDTGTGDATDATSEPVPTGSADTTAPPLTDTTAPPPTDTSATGETTTADTGPGACVDCDDPNQVCMGDTCVTLCQGQDPSPCPMGQVCDVISGECKPEASACTLAGPDIACGERTCGPGSACDDQGSCVPVAPCADVACTEAGACWGAFCQCERPVACADPGLADLNGPFSDKIIGVDFADDCTAWMVTLRDGVDYLRRLRPNGELSEWPGVSNLDMGEVKVLRSLTVPQLSKPFPLGNQPKEPPPPSPVEGLGEVAITYTCIGGCDGDAPQGVARLVEDNPNDPLPIVIVATVTTGVGPFEAPVADAGPQGLTWGVDRVLYVGNSTANGEFNRADLEMGTQELVTTLPARVHASAPVSPVHLLVALEGGALVRYNVVTQVATPVAELGAHATALSQDPFTNQVYASLSTLEVVEVDPFTGVIEPFDTMPGKGRVAVSPSGKLYFIPADYLVPGDISAWDLPLSY